MPQQFYIKTLHQVVLVADNAFAAGGEGTLFAVLRPTELSHCVAKIFHHNKRDAQKEAKINYLINNPPIFEGDQKEQPVVWAKYALYDADNEFVGFIMPKATGEKLEILTAPKLPKYLGKAWHRFRLGGDEALRLRLKVCYNLAAALRTIHATGRYVLVDLKPDNVLIKSNGVVSIVDTDSIEVIENNKTLFPATVATPEYTPSEYYKGVQPGQVLIEPSWDHFSLAVIYYRMLFGVHPYAATAKEPYDNINSLGDKIKHGLFVHHPEMTAKFAVVPPPHRQFDQLDKPLRHLFFKAFIDGFEQPEARPSAEDWGQALMSNPLLLIDRDLPSKSLNLDVINNKNWYVLALQKSMSEQNLLALPKDSYQPPLNVAYTSEAVLQEAIAYYKQAGAILWKVTKYFGIVFTVAMTLFIGATVIAGEPFQYMAFALGQIWGMLTFIPSLIIDLGGIGLFFLILLMPFLVATFRQFTGMANDKTQDVRKNLTGIFAITDAQKQDRLLELQYTLRKQRTKVKNQLREIENQLNALLQFKIRKEKEFFQNNNKKIIESNREITNKLRSERTEIQMQDNKAKNLMLEEANLIKKLRLDLQNSLKEHPIYSKINGKTVQQKIIFLEQQGDEAALFEGLEMAQIKADLLALEQATNEKLAAVKADFDEKHAELLNDTSQYKIKIDDIVEGSVESMREKIRIDTKLMDDSFKGLLKNIKKLQIENNAKEAELEELQEDIKQLKEELKLFQRLD